MADTITHITAESLQNNVDTGNKMIFHKSNFNMPVKDLWSDISNWIRFSGPMNYTGTATSFNVSDFSPGFEVFGTSAIFDWDNPGGSGYDVDAYLYQKFYDTDGSTVLYANVNGWNYVETIPASSWGELMYTYTQGLSPWEIDTSDTFYTKAWATGTGAIGTTTQNLTLTNVPSVTQLSSSYTGYIWVEGNNLCFVNANRWKHTLVGTQVSTSPGASNAGYIWIDSTDLHWVGNNGYDYKAAWKVKQFESNFTNSSMKYVYIYPTVDTSTETLSIYTYGNPFIDGTGVTLSSAGSLPGGLSAGTEYFVRDAVVTGANTQTFRLSATAGGSAVNLTSNGSGDSWAYSGSHYAGTANAGYIWVDSEFGLTHLSYIGSDGYKYLTGAGVDPYA